MTREEFDHVFETLKDEEGLLALLEAELNSVNISKSFTIYTHNGFQRELSQVLTNHLQASLPITINQLIVETKATIKNLEKQLNINH